MQKVRDRLAELPGSSPLYVVSGLHPQHGYSADSTGTKRYIAV